MVEYICGIAFSYTSADVANWGTLFMGLGTIGLAYAAIKKLPEALNKDAKSQDVIKMYQRVVYRMFREVEASEEGRPFSLPSDREKLFELMFQKFPQLGSLDKTRAMMDDLMLDKYFKHVRGNADVLVTVQWDPVDREKKVDPVIENVPPQK